MVKVGQLNSKDFPANKKYAIPLSITGASNYSLIPSQRSAILLLNRSILSSVAKVSGGEGIRIKPVGMHTKAEWTIQMSAIYSSLTRSNLTTAYLSNGTGGEFYTRISSTAGIQVKTDATGTTHGLKYPCKRVNGCISPMCTRIRKRQSMSTERSRRSLRTVPSPLARTA